MQVCKICNNQYLVLSSDGICIDCILERSKLVKAFREKRLIKVVGCPYCGFIQATSAVEMLRCRICKKSTRIKSLRIFWQGNDAHQAIKIVQSLSELNESKMLHL